MHVLSISTATDRDNIAIFYFLSLLHKISTNATVDFGNKSFF